MRALAFMRGWVEDEPKELARVDRQLRSTERRYPWVGALILALFGGAEIGGAVWLALWIKGLVG